MNLWNYSYSSLNFLTRLRWLVRFRPRKLYSPEIASCYGWWEAGIGSHFDLSDFLQGTELHVLGPPTVGKLLQPLCSPITLYCRQALNIIEDKPEWMRFFGILQKYIMNMWAEVNCCHVVVFSVTTLCDLTCTYPVDGSIMFIRKVCTNWSGYKML